jgi:hypothetical protein
MPVGNFLGSREEWAKPRGRKLSAGNAARRSRRSRCPAKVRPSYVNGRASRNRKLPRRTGEHGTAMSKLATDRHLLHQAWTFGVQGKPEAEGITIGLEGKREILRRGRSSKGHPCPHRHIPHPGGDARTHTERGRRRGSHARCCAPCP